MRQFNLRDKLFVQIPIDVIVYFRVVFGAIMIWEVYRYFSKEWIAKYWIDVSHRFHFEGFSWVTAWPGEGMYIHFWVLGAAAAGILLGFLYRISAITFFLGFTYVFLLDQTRYLNHFYLVCLISFLMIFIPAHRAFSVDSLIFKKLRSKTIDQWCLWILRFQVAVVYVYGGIAKINPDWLRGEPMRIWLARRDEYAIIGPFVEQEWFVYMFSYGGLAYDLFIVPLLIWRRTRWFALVLTVLFHLTNAYIFSIGIFPWFMLAAVPLFFEADWLRRLAARILRREISAVPYPEEQQVPVPWQGITKVCLFAYVFLQVFIPLRHFLYPGNVNWTEEGHQFSWHMKLRTKTAEIKFIVSDPDSGQEWIMESFDDLRIRQMRKMRRHPRMILQYAHHLAEKKRVEGYPNIEVRAKVEARLNGRRPQSLIDPHVDLAKERVSIWPARWILPLNEPLRR